ncbi:MAG: HAMP domain-containing protein, partial [Elusimicrobia bacterium]|nr:HAMP domain-containing protein [Elusimicrobiota bacterium]
LDLAVPVFAAPAKGSGDDFLLADAGDAAPGARVGTVRIGLPLDETMALERAISAGIFRGVLILGGAAGAILFGFMRRVLAPIGLLAAATAKIRGGDYRVTVPETSGDEIGALARSFNEMSRQLGRTTVSKDFFNDILDSIQDQVIVTDAAGLIVLVNPAVVKQLGWTREELIGRPADSLLDGGAASFRVPASNAAVNLLTKTGEKAAVLFSSSAIKATVGSAAGFIGAAKDVSDVRRLEARMHQSEKLSAVGQLAAGVAHEINNPLGVILGFAQGMARQLSAGDALELPIKSIEREALRCKALVQNLLTFARTSHPDRAAMDVNQTIEQSLSLIAPQAKIARVAVVTRLAAALPPVLGNKNQLEQVIMNLAKNAIDAMPDGGTLTLSTELQEAGPHSWVCLRFADDGAGIPASVLPKIFDPFFTTKPIGQGTGLGLSLVSEIVQKHSGEVSVESRPGRTEFTVKLPARTGQELERRAESLRAERSAAPKASGSISHGSNP